MPDTFLIYGDALSTYELCDTRYLRHEQRFFLTHNQLDPKVYAITKVQDLVPQGIIKLTLKQGELDNVRDNVDLMVCDYYNGSGEVVIKKETHIDETARSYIWSAVVDDDGILQCNHEQNRIIHLATLSYYNVEFFLKGVLQDLNSEWRIDYNGDSDLTDEEKQHLCDLIVIRQINKTTISVRAGKTKKLIGEKFILRIVRDLDDKTNNDIICKKDKLRKMFNEDPDLKDVLGVLPPKPLNEYLNPSNPTEDELKIRQEIIEYNEKIKHEQIVPFLKLNGLQKEVLNFVMFDIRDDGTSYYNDTVKKQYIEVMCVVHEDDMETEYGIVRTDLLDYIIRDLLCWTNSLGFHVVLEEDRPYIVDADYYCRRMRFVINAPNIVNKHMGRINKYDNYNW